MSTERRKNHLKIVENLGIGVEKSYNSYRRPILGSIGALGALGLGARNGAATGSSVASKSAPGFDPFEATVADVLSAITDGRTTARSVTEAYLERIDAFDDELNAFITVNDRALERAAELDESFEESGLVGPLHGVPIVLKDNYDTADMPTTAGSVLFEDSVPADDAFSVRRFREAGGVVIGKTNLDEYAAGGVGRSSLGGQTYNPYDVERIPRGSSGGTGAAIGASLGIVGTGSDTASSIRGPSTAQSLVGIRPTIGTVSRDGIVPLALTQDTGGPMTRTVTDNAIAMDVMSGYDPADPVTARGVGETPASTGESYTDSLDPEGLEGVRLGVPREFYETAPGFVDPVDSDPDVIEVVDAALEEMAALGAEIVDPIEIPGLFEAVRQVDVIDFEQERDVDAYLEGLENPPVDSFAEIVESRTAVSTIAGALESSEETDVEGLEENPEYLARLAERTTIRDLLFDAMASDDLDAIVYPSENLPPGRIDSDDANGGGNTFISAGSGFPAITVPAGFTDCEELPVGVEFLSRPFTEELLFEMAYAYEQGTMHRRPPADFGALE